VRQGRRREFAQAYAQLGGDDIFDALAPETFRAAVLDWDVIEEPVAHKRLTLVRDLLMVRQRELVPPVVGARFGRARREGGVLAADWRLGAGNALVLVANLSNASADRPRGLRNRRPLWNEAISERLPPWSVFWSLGEN